MMLWALTVLAAALLGASVGAKMERAKRQVEYITNTRGDVHRAVTVGPVAISVHKR